MRNFAIAFLSLTLATSAIIGCSSDDSSYDDSSYDDTATGVEASDASEATAADGSTAKPSGSGSRE